MCLEQASAKPPAHVPTAFVGASHCPPPRVRRRFGKERVPAFVIIDGAWSRESDLNGEARARGAHAAFVQRFGADDPTVAHVPILRYGGGERGGFEEVQVQVRRRSSQSYLD